MWGEVQMVRRESKGDYVLFPCLTQAGMLVLILQNQYYSFKQGFSRNLLVNSSNEEPTNLLFLPQIPSLYKNSHEVIWDKMIAFLMSMFSHSHIKLSKSLIWFSFHSAVSVNWICLCFPTHGILQC